jgi:hypothetical protein
LKESLQDRLASHLFGFKPQLSAGGELHLGTGEVKALLTAGLEREGKRFDFDYESEISGGRNDDGSMGAALKNTFAMNYRVAGTAKFTFSVGSRLVGETGPRGEYHLGVGLGYATGMNWTLSPIEMTFKF